MKSTLFLVFSLLIVATGCQRKPQPQGRFTPPDGSARLLATTLKETPDTLHYKWSVIGDRSWNKATVTGNALALTEVYKLNDPSNPGACHTWECDLSATKTSGGWKVVYTVHGSNGQTATGEATTTETPQRVQSNTTEDFRLPATITLCRVGNETATLTLPEK